MATTNTNLTPNPAGPQEQGNTSGTSNTHTGENTAGGSSNNNGGYSPGEKEKPNTDKEKEKYLGESALIGQPKKKLNFAIADKAITPEKLSDRVMSEVVKPYVKDIVNTTVSTAVSAAKT